ncbi:MAG: DUF4855 domain-containing protein [Armatimonadetes bacterium]|nr:DUF4855 domain-containing protein [Armatimonadota bacterium]
MLAIALFHHCVLIYDAPKRPAEGYMPLVAHLDARGRPDQWLFDAFLFCAHEVGPSTGVSYHEGATNRADWEALQDGFFAPERGPAALQAAIDRAEETLGKLRTPVQVVITIPFPSPEQKDFGDANGDGKSEDLSQDAGLDAAAAWYVQQVLDRWQPDKFPDLRLWGFYWTHESLRPGEVERVQRVARIVHDRGYRFMWIPWFRAPGFERWRECGFDVAFLQPNYAFLSDHLGAVRNDRLLETARLASDAGLSVEMEVGYNPESDLRVREIFRDYMAFGARSRCGYQSAPLAYFQSFDVFGTLCRATDPDARRVYDELAAFIHGKPIPVPGLVKSWTSARLGSTIKLDHPRAVGEVQFSIARGDAAWTGTLVAEARSRGGDWGEPSWLRATVPAREGSAALAKVLPVPIFADDVDALRLTATPDPGQPPPAVYEVSVTCGEPRVDWLGDAGLAHRCAYRVEPDFPRKHPDPGGLLTDGQTATEGWTQGRSVGWTDRDVAVRLDLGRPAPIDRVVVYCDGGGAGGAQYPDQTLVQLGLAGSPLPVGAAGRGSLPPPPDFVATLDRSAVTSYFARQMPDGEVLGSGRLELRPPSPVPARYVTLQFLRRTWGWVLLSEIEVYSHGPNLAPGGSYTFTPQPTAVLDVKYPDDGRLLTDGYVARSFLAQRLAGWSKGEHVTATLDLGAARTIREVTVHSLGGGLYGILAPGGAALELSDEGTDFREVASATAQDPGGEVCVQVPIALKPEREETARFLRVKVRPSREWLMLSEITVH